MKITHKPVAPIGAQRGTPQYDFIDEDTDKTVLHLEVDEEEYSAEWPTYAERDHFIEFLQDADPEGSSEITAGFENLERGSKDTLTSDLQTIQNQDLYDWEDCTSIEADLAAIEISWAEEERDQYKVGFHSHNGKITPLAKTYSRLPYSDYQVVNEDYEQFLHGVMSSAESVLEDELTISI